MILGFCGYGHPVGDNTHRIFCGYGMGMGIEIPFPRQPWRLEAWRTRIGSVEVRINEVIRTSSPVSTGIGDRLRDTVIHNHVKNLLPSLSVRYAITLTVFHHLVFKLFIFTVVKI